MSGVCCCNTRFGDLLRCWLIQWALLAVVWTGTGVALIVTKHFLGTQVRCRLTIRFACSGFAKYRSGLYCNNKQHSCAWQIQGAPIKWDRCRLPISSAESGCDQHKSCGDCCTFWDPSELLRCLTMWRYTLWFYNYKHRSAFLHRLLAVPGRHSSMQPG